MDKAPLRIEGLEPALRPGEVLALLGAEGEAMVLGLAGLGPARHAAFLGDQPLAGLPPHRRGLGAVLHPPGLFPGLSVAANVAWPLRLGRAENALSAEAALAALGMQPAAAALAGGLPPALALRVALARALATRPAALLLQNPFAGLEPEERLALAALLRRLGPPVVLATADAASALLAADRLAVFDQGRLLQQGPPQQVYARPAEALVARLTGPVNFLPGRLLETFDDEARVALDAGGEVEAMLAGDLPVGARCQVMLRPERLAVAAVAPEAMGDGALAATLRAVAFQGSQLRLALALADGAEVIALRPAGLRLPALGEACAVAWETGQALVFPA